jgi:hypothetical protein
MDEHSRKYAVLFRTHFWDSFTQRQYKRLSEKTRSADIYILMDETSQKAPLRKTNIVRHTQSDVLSLGLHDGGTGNVLWYNGDYPLYFFFLQNKQYEHYVMAEYDVTVNVSLDDLVDRIRRDQIDFVGLTQDGAIEDWPFAKTCADFYNLSQIKKSLICFSVYSHRAVQALLERRLEHSERAFREQGITWPHCEAFIPTELAARGFKLAELSKYGAADYYDWNPALTETDLPLLRQQAFLHPVLDPARYVQRSLKDVWPPEEFFYPRSKLRRKLRRVPLTIYGMPLAHAIREHVTSFLRKRVV